MKRYILSFSLLLSAFSLLAQQGSINIGALRSRVADSTTVVVPSGYGVLEYKAQTSEWIGYENGVRKKLFPALFTSSLRGLVPASGGGTTNFLRADGTFAAPGGISSSLSSAHILVGNGSNVATDVAMTGDISITNAGVTAYSGTLPVNKGGTNLSSYTVGDFIYASGSTTLSKLAAVAIGDVLLSNGTGTAPVYGKVTSSHVDTTIPTATKATVVGPGSATTMVTVVANAGSNIPNDAVAVYKMRAYAVESTGNAGFGAFINCTVLNNGGTLSIIGTNVTDTMTSSGGTATLTISTNQLILTVTTGLTGPAKIWYAYEVNIGQY